MQAVAPEHTRHPKQIAPVPAVGRDTIVQAAHIGRPAVRFPGFPWRAEVILRYLHITLLQPVDIRHRPKLLADAKRLPAIRSHTVGPHGEPALIRLPQIRVILSPTTTLQMQPVRNATARYGLQAARQRRAVDAPPKHLAGLAILARVGAR